MKKMLQKLICNALFFPETSWSDNCDEEMLRLLFEEAAAQDLLSILYDYVSKNKNIPTEQLNCWKRVAFEKQFSNIVSLNEQSALSCLLDMHNIPYAYIKGVAVAQYYPNIICRTSGDIDFIVLEGMYKKTYDLLCNNGFKMIEDRGYHSEFIKNGVRYELHRTLPLLPDSKYGKRTFEIIQDGIMNAKVIEICGYQYKILPSKQNGIVLLRHVLQHLRGGIGIKQLIDWAVYVDAELDDRAWNKYQNVYKACGLDYFAIQVTGACQNHFGLRVSGINWCVDSDEQLGDYLVEYAFNKGNLGSRNNHFEPEKGVVALSRDDGIIGFFRRLQEHGKKNWKKNPKSYFIHFAWIGTFITYVKFVLTRSKPISSLFTDVFESKKRKKMFRTFIGKDFSLIDDERNTKYDDPD